MKKLISMFMVLAILGGVVVGCSGEKKDDAAAPATGSEKPAEETK